jgi:hypothetical protein
VTEPDAYLEAAALVEPLAALVRKRHGVQVAIDAEVRAAVVRNATAIAAVNEALGVLRHLTAALGDNAGTSTPYNLDEQFTAASVLLDDEANP